jgi:hypothetical protein
MDIPPLIQERTEACQELFRKFTNTYPADEWFENRQADFQLWSVGLRASASGKSSLDYKLKAHQQTRDMICDYLDGLKELLQRHLLAPERDLSVHGDNGDDSGSDDADLFDLESDIFKETRTAVKLILYGLARISTFIRRAGTKFRFKEADGKFDEKNFRDAKMMYSLHIYREQGKSRQRIRDNSNNKPESPEQSTDEARSTALDDQWMTRVQARLVKANLYRHNRMLHNSQSMRNLPQPKVDPKFVPPVATPTPGKLPDTSEHSMSNLVDEQTPNAQETPGSESGETHTQSMTHTATDIESQYDENVALKEQTPSLFTQATGTGKPLQYPSCPKPEIDGLRWCPFCGDILSEDYYINKSRWRCVIFMVPNSNLRNSMKSH